MFVKPFIEKNYKKLKFIFSEAKVRYYRIFVSG